MVFFFAKLSSKCGCQNSSVIKKTENRRSKKVDWILEGRLLEIQKDVDEKRVLGGGGGGGDMDISRDLDTFNWMMPRILGENYSPLWIVLPPSPSPLLA